MENCEPVRLDPTAASPFNELLIAVSLMRWADATFSTTRPVPPWNETNSSVATTEVRPLKAIPSPADEVDVTLSKVALPPTRSGPRIPFVNVTSFRSLVQSVNESGVPHPTKSDQATSTLAPVASTCDKGLFRLPPA